MNIPNPKLPYETGHFINDFECRDWLNEKFDEGYVVDQLTTTLVAGSRDTRRQDVRITVIMKLDLPNVPSSAAVRPSKPAATSLRDLRFADDAPGLCA